MDISLSNLHASLAADLAAKGFVVLAGYFNEDLVRMLREEAAALDLEATERAGVGRADDLITAPDIRRTRIKWLTGETLAQQAFLREAETLRLALNAQLFLGLFEFEAHFANYPPGGFYARHVDSFRGRRNRIVSLVAYLDCDRTITDGGLLLIYGADEGAPVATIVPAAGTMVLLLSEEVPHEVTPTRLPRHAIAGWYRLNQTTSDRPDPPE